MISNGSLINLIKEVRSGIYPNMDETHRWNDNTKQMDTKVVKSGYVVFHNMSFEDIKNVSGDRKQDLLGFIEREYRREYVLDFKRPLDIPEELFEKTLDQELSNMTEERFLNGVDRGILNTLDYYDEVKDVIEESREEVYPGYYSSVKRFS